MIQSNFKTTLLLFLLSLISISCNKEELIESHSEGINECFLSFTTVEQEYVLHLGNTTNPIFWSIREEEFSYTYNEKSLLTSISFQFEEFSCSPNQEGIDDICNDFDGGELIELYNDETQINLEIEEFRYFYVNDKLSKIENWNNYSDNSSTELILYSYSIYTYDGQNISEKSDFFLEREASARTVSKNKLYEINPETEPSDFIKESITTYLFDDKINPYYGSIISIIDNSHYFYNENNVTQTSVEYLYTDGSSSTVSSNLINYEYDENDFPIIMNYEEPSDIQTNIFRTSFIYQCN